MTSTDKVIFFLYLFDLYFNFFYYKLKEIEILSIMSSFLNDSGLSTVLEKIKDYTDSELTSLENSFEDKTSKVCTFELTWPGAYLTPYYAYDYTMNVPTSIIYNDKIACSTSNFTSELNTKLEEFFTMNSYEGESISYCYNYISSINNQSLIEKLFFVVTQHNSKNPMRGYLTGNNDKPFLCSIQYSFCNDKATYYTNMYFLYSVSTFKLNGKTSSKQYIRINLINQHIYYTKGSETDNQNTSSSLATLTDKNGIVTINTGVSTWNNFTYSYTSPFPLKITVTLSKI